MGPKIAPCETPKIIFRTSLNSEPTSVMEIKDDFLSKPKAFNFAISKPWGIESKALER